MYNPGDHVTVEFATESSTESEWMWVEVRRSDDELQILFGRLDSRPIVHTELKVGQELAVSSKRSESTDGSTATENLATYFGQPEYRYGNLPPAEF
jgi:hypothetical protein